MYDRVNAVVGPIYKRRGYDITIEDNEQKARRNKWSHTDVVDVLVYVNDGRLTISGDPGLPIIRIEIERLE